MRSILRLTSTHVKTRRLYYLYEIAKLIDYDSPLNYDVLYARVYEFASHNNHLFEKYEDPTGEIKSRRAFDRYLNLSIEMGLTKVLENKYVNTVDGTILANLNMEEGKPYGLPYSLKFFFFRKILERDFDYIKVLLRLSKSREINNSTFVEELQYQMSNEELSKDIVDALNEMRNWKNPRYFQENIYAPRRSWLIDLDLIVPTFFTRKATLLFRDESRLLIEKISLLTKGQFYEYIQGEFYQDLAGFLLRGEKVNLFSTSSLEVRANIVNYYLDRLFNDFGGSLDLKRISSKFFLEYVPILLLCEKRIVLSREELERELFAISSSNNAKYRYRPAAFISESGERVDAGYITQQR